MRLESIVLGYESVMEIEENREVGTDASQKQECQEFVTDGDADGNQIHIDTQSPVSRLDLSSQFNSWFSSCISTMPSSATDNPSCNTCTLHMALPFSESFTEPPRQQIIVQHSVPSVIHFRPIIPLFDPTKLKPIDLSVPLPVTNLTLDPGVANKIWEMNTNRMISHVPESARSRAMIPVSHCRNQLRLARKRVLSKLGVPTWSEEKKLLAAVRNADASAVIQLLQDGVNPNISDIKRRTPLHIAASQGLDDIVSHLVATRADPNRQDILGNTPLHLAVCRGDTRTVNILLRSGANINQRDNVGRTPLCIVKSRLGTLRKDKSISTDKLISECHMISDILKVHLKGQPDNGSATENDMCGSSVDVLCSMIKNISTREQADEIADTMIKKMSGLQIVNTRQTKEDKKQGWFLSIL